MFTGQDLKGGQGNPDWLRLFTLMSAEFAMAEGCPEPPNAPTHGWRLGEIKTLSRKLKAVHLLDNLSNIVRWTEGAFIKGEWTHYLIKYDNVTKIVTVEPYMAPILAVSSYDEAEFLDFRSGMDRKNMVLVEVDKIESLREAYPNYFGDVQLFKKQLRDITKGLRAREYTLPPRETVPPPHKENPDLAWLRGRSRPRWK
jgi:hypothetical protein